MLLESRSRHLGVWFAAVNLGLFAICPLCARAEATFHGPSGYLSFADSPFNGAEFAYFYLETFEEGALNTPGLSINSGWTILDPALLTDSVDGDDGTIDGSGIGGHSFYSGGGLTNLTLSFDADGLGGHLPTDVGVVCTDIGGVLFGELGIGDVTFTALDADGRPLGSITATNFGNGSAEGNSPGATAEDRFFGVSNPDGISSVTLFAHNSIDWEVDHLQYGYRGGGDFGPKLNIQSGTPNTVVLSWPTNATGFTLQETTSFPVANWTPVTTPPSLVGNQNEVTVTPLSGNHFYRLIGP